MTCDGCGADVTLLDGHYCGHCSSTIAAAVKNALTDLEPLLEVEAIHDVFVDDDHLLNIRVETERGEDFEDEVDDLIERERETLDALDE